MKKFIYLGITVVGGLGTWLGSLLDKGGLGWWSLLGSAIGSFVGIWAGYMIGKTLE